MKQFFTTHNVSSFLAKMIIWLHNLTASFYYPVPEQTENAKEYDGVGLISWSKLYPLFLNLKSERKLVSLFEYVFVYFDITTLKEPVFTIHMDIYFWESQTRDIIDP